MEKSNSGLFVVVVATESARGFMPPDDCKVIAVNGAIDYLPRVDYWFTLDPTPENVSIMNHRRAGVEYYAALSNNIPLPGYVHRLERVSAPKIKCQPTQPEHWLARYGCIPRLSDDPGKINTGNSAWGALQLAKHLGAKRVLLVGIDADKRRKLDGKYSSNLEHLPLLFAGAVGHIEFANVGKMAVPGMPRFDTHHEGIAWLKQ